MGLAAGLGHDEQAETLVGLAAVRIGARQQHQHVGASGERAPRLHAVDDVAGRAVGSFGGSGGHLQSGHVAAVVGFGHRDRGHHLGGGQLGQPLGLLGLGSALHQSAREDLGTRDERTTDAQARATQFLGGHDHGHVLALAALGEAAVLDGHGQSEGTHLGQTTDDLLGDVFVVAMNVLGARRDDLLGERAEGVLHHLEVVVEVTRSLHIGQRGHELGVTVRGDERNGGGQGVGLQSPQRFATDQLRHQVVGHVGGVSAGDETLMIALGAVVEQGAGGLHG